MTTISKDILRGLQLALEWELRAQILYSHYAAHVRGLHRLTLKSFFESEALESMNHAASVRGLIVKYGAECGLSPSSWEIPHTTDPNLMLREASRTEEEAAKRYRDLLVVIDDSDPESRDTIEQILFDEERSLQELTLLLG